MRNGSDEMEKHNELRQALESALDADMKLSHLHVDETDSLVTVIVAVPAARVQEERSIKRQIAKVVKVDLGYGGVKVAVEARKSNPATSKQTKYITITSGKGGVGKSTVAANLAVCLAKYGYKVGLIDTDVYGASLPKIFGMKAPQLFLDENDKIIPPVTTENVMIMSTGFLVEDDQPLMWRGPMLVRMMDHLFNDVAWPEDTNYIVVDLPPGTGDIPLNLKELIPEAKAIVVTTPNKLASEIATKSGEMAKKLGHEVLGVVENMSYFVNPANGDHEEIFGNGGAELVAEQLDIEVLGKIAIAQVKADAKNGIFTSHEENGMLYLGLANKVLSLLK